MATEKSSEYVRRVHVKEDREDEIGEVEDLDAGGKLLAGPGVVSLSGESQSRRRRGKDPAEKESSRLKRLLRNRVSAQQAREKKKVYVNELEKKFKDLEAKNTELQERLSILQKENHMLRHILKNTTSSSNR